MPSIRGSSRRSCALRLLLPGDSVAEQEGDQPDAACSPVGTTKPLSRSAGQPFEHAQRRQLRMTLRSDRKIEGLLQRIAAAKGGMGHLIGEDQPDAGAEGDLGPGRARLIAGIGLGHVVQPQHVVIIGAAPAAGQPEGAQQCGGAR